MKNVLLVDDDDVANFVNSSMLRKTGMAGEIHTAQNGQEAIDMLNGYLAGNISLPEVILLDLNMPLMDGFGFIEAFNRILDPHERNVTIVIVTSSSHQMDIARAEKMGIAHYLTKPVKEEQLIELLK